MGLHGITILQILCLHGYRQNADTFRAKTGSLRKMLKKYAEFEFITAPHIPNIPDESVSTDRTADDPRGWWFSRSEHHFKATDQTQLDTGFEQSVALIVEHCKQNTYDGLMGFSQGACFVGLLLALQQQNKIDLGVRFSIQVASFLSQSEKHSYQSSTQIQLPTLFIHGRNDVVIPKELSERVLCLYSDCTELVHDGGHMVPTCTPFKQQLHSFFTPFL